MKFKSAISVCILLFVFLILSIFKIYCCPLKYIFGLSCPTCGITRAIVYAFQLNFLTAFHYHLFWPIVIIGFVIYLLYDAKKIHVSKKTMILIANVFCILNLIYYFYRLFNGSEIVYFDFTESLLYKIINII